MCYIHALVLRVGRLAGYLRVVEIPCRPSEPIGMSGFGEDGRLLEGSQRPIGLEAGFG